jgi:ATP-dependent DNA helicase RecQ
VLFYRQQDISAQSFKTGSGRVDSAALEAVYDALTELRGPMSREELSHATNLSPRKLVSVLQRLEEAGAIKQLESGEIDAAGGLPLRETIEAADQRQQFQKELRKRRLLQVQGYAECRSCRRQYLLRYFGAETAGPCGNCDRCEEAGVLRRAA